MITTHRLVLRQWIDSDLESFAALNADKEVMRYFPNCLSRQQSDAMAIQIQKLIAQRGWGFWAVSLNNDTHMNFIGFVGLHIPTANLPCSPCVEIGWRLHKKYWGNGYATEAAYAALKYAFDVLNLKEVVSFTALNNLPSQAVMQRLCMKNTHRDFLHPNLQSSHPLATHVLYKVTHRQWQQLNHPQKLY